MSKSELPCIRTQEPYWPLARAVLWLATLETVLPFIFTILNAGVMFQHKALLNRSMLNMGKDFLQITWRYNFLNGAVIVSCAEHSSLSFTFIIYLNILK